MPASGEPTGELQAWSGSRPVSFTLDSLTGARVALDEHHGRVVLVHFFATWCEPCRAEMSALQELSDRFAQRPVTILALDVGEVDARVRRFFESNPVRLSVLLDRDRAVARAWNVSTLPTTIVLDRTLAPRLAIEGEFDWSGAQAERALVALLDAGAPE